MKIVIFILLSSLATVSFSQIKSKCKLLKQVEKDSTIYSNSCNVYYNYFNNRYDSVVIDFDNYKSEKVEILYKFSNANKIGYLKYFFQGRIMAKYQVENNRISGEGLLYTAVLPDSKPLIILKAHFKKGKLNGDYYYYSFITGKLLAKRIYKNNKIIKEE